MNRRLRDLLKSVVPAVALGATGAGTAAAQGMMGMGQQQQPGGQYCQEMMQRCGGYGGGMMGPGMGMMGPGMGMMGPGMGMMGPGMGMMGPGTGMMGPGMGMMGPGMGTGPSMMQGYGGGMMGPGYGQGPAMLDLTEEQQKKLQQLQQQTQKQQMQQAGELQQAMQQYQAELSKEEPDPKAVGQAYDKLAAAQKKMLESRLQAQNQMRGVLTDEQRQQMRGMMRGMW